MRLGAPIFQPYSDPQEWARLVRENGYSAAYSPVSDQDDETKAAAYVEEARKANIIIAEVGAWSNPISTDDAEREKAIRLCQDRLALADRIGAVCCVNIAGSRGAKWDGPHASNLSDDTFALIVDTVRTIIDAVKPKRAYYTLEPMPWVFPDSPDSYLRLIQAIDREQFGVHFDPVNIISSPQLYYYNADFLRECFKKLGPYIKSCHAKDIVLQERLTVHLDEVRPGLGALDYGVFLTELNRLHPDIPLMLEHLDKAEDYQLAADYVRSKAQEQNLTFVG